MADPFGQYCDGYWTFLVTAAVFRGDVCPQRAFHIPISSLDESVEDECVNRAAEAVRAAFQAARRYAYTQERIAKNP